MAQPRVSQDEIDDAEAFLLGERPSTVPDDEVADAEAMLLGALPKTTKAKIPEQDKSVAATIKDFGVEAVGRMMGLAGDTAGTLGYLPSVPWRVIRGAKQLVSPGPTPDLDKYVEGSTFFDAARRGAGAEAQLRNLEDVGLLKRNRPTSLPGKVLQSTAEMPAMFLQGSLGMWNRAPSMSIRAAETAMGVPAATSRVGKTRAALADVTRDVTQDPGNAMVAAGAVGAPVGGAVGEFLGRDSPPEVQEKYRQTGAALGGIGGALGGASAAALNRALLPAFGGKAVQLATAARSAADNLTPEHRAGALEAIAAAERAKGKVDPDVYNRLTLAQLAHIADQSPGVARSPEFLTAVEAAAARTIPGYSKLVGRQAGIGDILTGNLDPADVAATQAMLIPPSARGAARQTAASSKAKADMQLHRDTIAAQAGAAGQVSAADAARQAAINTARQDANIAETASQQAEQTLAASEAAARQGIPSVADVQRNISSAGQSLLGSAKAKSDAAQALVKSNATGTSFGPNQVDSLVNAIDTGLADAARTLNMDVAGGIGAQLQTKANALKAGLQRTDPNNFTFTVDPRTQQLVKVPQTQQATLGEIQGIFKQINAWQGEAKDPVTLHALARIDEELVGAVKQMAVQGFPPAKDLLKSQRLRAKQGAVERGVADVTAASDRLGTHDIRTLSGAETEAMLPVLAAQKGSRRAPAAAIESNFGMLPLAQAVERAAPGGLGDAMAQALHGAAPQVQTVGGGRLATMVRQAEALQREAAAAQAAREAANRAHGQVAETVTGVDKTFTAAEQAANKARDAAIAQAGVTQKAQVARADAAAKRRLELMPDATTGGAVLENLHAKILDPKTTNKDLTSIVAVSKQGGVLPELQRSILNSFRATIEDAVAGGGKLTGNEAGFNAVMERYNKAARMAGIPDVTIAGFNRMANGARAAGFKPGAAPKMGSEGAETLQQESAFLRGILGGRVGTFTHAAISKFAKGPKEYNEMLSEVLTNPEVAKFVYGYGGKSQPQFTAGLLGKLQKYGSRWYSRPGFMGTAGAQSQRDAPPEYTYETVTLQ